MEILKKLFIKFFGKIWYLLVNNIVMKKKIIRLTEEDLVRIVKKVVNEQYFQDNLSPSSVQDEPEVFSWKPYFDNLTNSLDSYFDTIEGPVDVKRFGDKVRTEFYQMMNDADRPIDDEHTNLYNEFRLRFNSKLKDLIKKYGKQ